MLLPPLQILEGIQISDVPKNVSEQASRGSSHVTHDTEFMMLFFRLTIRIMSTV